MTWSAKQINQHKNIRGSLSFSITGIIVAVIFALCMGIFYYRMLFMPLGLVRSITLHKGTSLKKLSHQLKKEDIFSHPNYVILQPIYAVV